MLTKQFQRILGLLKAVTRLNKSTQNTVSKIVEEY
jgi:hypothetical protein